MGRETTLSNRHALFGSEVEGGNVATHWRDRETALEATAKTGATSMTTFGHNIVLGDRVAKTKRK